MPRKKKIEDEEVDLPVVQNSFGATPLSTLLRADLVIGLRLWMLSAISYSATSLVSGDSSILAIHRKNFKFLRLTLPAGSRLVRDPEVTDVPRLILNDATDELEAMILTQIEQQIGEPDYA